MRGVAGISKNAPGGKGPLTRGALFTFSTDFRDVVRAQLLKMRRWPDNCLTSESKKGIYTVVREVQFPLEGNLLCPHFGTIFRYTEYLKKRVETWEKRVKTRRKKAHDHEVPEKNPRRYDGCAYAIGRVHQYFLPADHWHRFLYHRDLHQRRCQHGNRYSAVLPGYDPAVPRDRRRRQARRRAADCQVHHRCRHRYRRGQALRSRGPAGSERAGHHLRCHQLQWFCVPGPDEQLRRYG